MDFTRNIKILTWQGFFVGFSLWAPIAAIYFSEVSGSYVLGLSIFSVAMVSSAVFEIPTGVFSDLIGRKYTTMLGGLFYMLGGICYAVGLGYWWLFVGAVFEGLARAFYSGNNDALLYDSLNKSKRKEELEKWMGFIGSAEQWAAGIAAVVGGILAAKYSFGLVMWLSVIPLFLCFVTSWWLVEVNNKEKGEGNIYRHLRESVGCFVRNRKLRLLSLSDIIGFGLGESAYQFRSVFIVSLWPLWAIGVSRMLSSVGAALGFGWSGKIIKRFKAINVMMFHHIYGKFINLTALLFPSVLSPALMATTSLLYGSGSVARASLFQKEFTDKQRATMSSLNSLGKSISFALAATFFGLVADAYGSRTALIWGQILGFSATWLVWKLFKLSRAGG